jgi:ribosome-binding factor A
MPTIRQQRVSSLMFEELSILIDGELSDPKLTMARVTEVVVSQDLRSAKVYVSHQDEDVEQREVVAALRRATPYLRGELATRLSLRAVPELLFYYDDSPERAARIEELLQQIAAERNNVEAAADTTESGPSSAGEPDQSPSESAAGPDSSE